MNKKEIVKTLKESVIQYKENLKDMRISIDVNPNSMA